MELRQLEHFVAVAQENHFTHAADLLQISQSGLSASIRALEAELGTPLFVRSTRRVELTEAGRALLAESHRTLASVAAAQDAVAAVRGVLRGSLSVGGEQCLGVVDLPAQLARFRAAHPGVEIRLRFGGSAHLIDQLAAGRLDVALVAVTGPAPRGVDVMPLAAEPLVLLCHPGHDLATEREADLAALHGLTFVGFQPDWAARVLADRAFAAAGLPHRVELEVNDVHTLLDLVGHDLGVAIVPRPIAIKKQHKLHIVALRGDLPSWRVAAVASENPSPAARTLLAQLIHPAGAHPAAGGAGGRPGGTQLRAAARPGPARRSPQPAPG